MTKINTLEALIEIFNTHNYSTYERDNYDSFLKKAKFSYNVPSIHVTGTNGKGSIVNYLYQIYLANGYKVGIYTSPYFLNPIDMININNSKISLDEYLEIFNQYIDLFNKYKLSSFEIQTFIALTLFQKSNLDLVIVEVGMGGEIDATNCFDPILSIISKVELEHTNYLGRTISEIAESKAGIIKYQVPVLVGKLYDSALDVIKDTAKYLKSNFYIVDDYHNVRNENGIILDYLPIHDIKLGHNVNYQIENVSIAIEATNILKDKFPVSIEKTKEGILKFKLPARFEIINNKFIIDGAHNPNAIDSLMDSISKLNIKFHTVFACFKDKNIDSMLAKLNMYSESITLTTFDHVRARTEDDYFLYIGDYKFNQDYMCVINELLETYPDDYILITGSLAFAYLLSDKLGK